MSIPAGFQLGVVAITFAVTALVAHAFGAGWGTASGIAQIAFVGVLVALLLRAD